MVSSALLQVMHELRQRGEIRTQVLAPPQTGFMAPAEAAPRRFPASGAVRSMELRQGPEGAQRHAETHGLAETCTCIRKWIEATAI